MSDLTLPGQMTIRQAECPKIPTRLMQDGIAAWNTYQATGLHVTWEDADIWLAQLESGLDVAPPVATAPGSP
jgi:predicted transcriptional regulator